MPLQKGASHFPTNQREWDQFTRAVQVTPDPGTVTTISLSDKQVTYAKLQDVSAASVVGRLASSAGPPGAITASADDTFLARRAGVLGFSALGDSDIPASIARDAEVTAAISAFEVVADARYVQTANVLNGSATYDPPPLGDGAGATTTVACTGAAVGDFALASFAIDLQGITLTAYVSAADTVSVRFQNESGSTLDLAATTLRVRVWKQ